MIRYEESDGIYLLERSVDGSSTVIVTTPDGKREVWHDHAFNGSGCDNWVIEAGGESFDLEFCRSA